jgi:hypothetical protein
MASSLKPFVVKFYVNAVFRVRKVNARDMDEACARVRHAVHGSYSHWAEIEPALKHLYMGAV